MSKRISARKRYDLANPVISIRVTQDEFDKLDALRVIQKKEWRELLLSLLDISKSKTVFELGACSQCGKPHIIDLASKTNRENIGKYVNSQLPLCHDCEVAKTQKVQVLKK